MTIEEQEKLIKWTLVVFWSCRACRSLGWDKGCHQKSNCANHLYAKLKQHFEGRKLLGGEK